MDVVLDSFSAMGELALTPSFWIVLIIAILIAGPLGLIPGVGGTTTIAILLPFLILNVDATTGVIFVGALIALGQSVDILPAVILGYPGPSSTVDFLEGHQLARRGHGAHVVGATYTVSAVGGIIGAFFLIGVLPLLRPLILKFSFAEIAAVVIFGLAMVVLVSKGSLLRSLGAALLGLLLGTIGTASLTAIDRFAFDQLYLIEGLPLIPTILGLFALPEMIDLAMSRQPISAGGQTTYRAISGGMVDGLRRWKTIPRQSIFGAIMGAVPGIGGTAIEWLSYGLGVLFTKDKSQFGKGSLDGVLFTESAQAAKEAGQAIPTLAFGIPGGAGWAIMLVALLAYGIAPGLGMLGPNLDITAGLILAIAVGNVLSMMLALALGGQIIKLTRVPYNVIAGMLLPILFISAFQATFNWGDIWVLLGVGSLGLAMKWFGWPRAPFLLGFLLGGPLESNLWRALSIAGPGTEGFINVLTRPWTMGILITAVAFAGALLWGMSKSEAQLSAVKLADLSSTSPDGQVAEELPVPRGSSGTAPQHAVKPRFSMESLRRNWRWEYLFWLVLIAWAGGVVLRESMGYRDNSSKFFPQWASVLFLGVMAALVVTAVLRPLREKREIFDLPMRSGNDTAAVKQLAGVLIWIAGFVILSGIIGLQFVAVLFPLAFIPVRMRWYDRKALWALIPSAFSALVVFAILGQIVHVIWPSRFILNWLT